MQQGEGESLAETPSNYAGAPCNEESQNSDVASSCHGNSVEEAACTKEPELPDVAEPERIAETGPSDFAMNDIKEQDTSAGDATVREQDIVPPTRKVTTPTKDSASFAKVGTKTSEKVDSEIKSQSLDKQAAKSSSKEQQQPSDDTDESLRQAKEVPEQSTTTGLTVQAPAHSPRLATKGSHDEQETSATATSYQVPEQSGIPAALLPATKPPPPSAAAAAAAPLPTSATPPSQTRKSLRSTGAVKSARSSPTKPQKEESISAISISSIETQVYRAARLVAVELENGAWPEVTPGARRRAAAALEEFAKTIFLPNFLQDTSHHTPASCNERVFLATMLALREVLTQNASRIFDLKDVPLQGEEELRDYDTAPGNKRRKRHDKEEERLYMAQLFATGVIFAAIQSTSTPESESCLKRFTETMDSYDAGSDEFMQYMMQGRDGRHQGVMPNRKELPKEENVAWCTSFNRARELHPAVNKRGEMVQVPSPNAVFVSMVEQTSTKFS